MLSIGCLVVLKSVENLNFSLRINFRSLQILILN